MNGLHYSPPYPGKHPFFYQTTEWDDQTERPSLGLADFLPMKQSRVGWRRAAGSGLGSGYVNVNVKTKTMQSDS